jgi:hypothetical protein
LARWVWTTASLLLAAMWGTDLLMARRLSVDPPQAGDLSAAETAQVR